MRLSQIFTKKRILFILIFTALAFFADQFNFSRIIGADKQYFTLFQFFGPVAGAFLGPVFGTVSVLLSEIVNFALLGKAVEVLNLLRLTPMLFAAFYFGKFGRRNLSAVVPLLAMAAFWLHPVGAQAWFYALYWLIPAIALLFPKRLFARSLGATFTAHSVGSVIFLYTIPMTAEAWIALIPVVAYERFMFAVGISFAYVALNLLLSRLSSWAPGSVLRVDYSYIPRWFMPRQQLRA